MVAYVLCVFVDSKGELDVSNSAAPGSSGKNLQCLSISYVAIQHASSFDTLCSVSTGYWKILYSSIAYPHLYLNT